MNQDPILQNLPAPPNNDILTAFGFRFGDKGTHTSRTIMLHELEALLQSCPKESIRSEYDKAVIDHNCLGKQTVASRELSAQRLRELYAIDPAVPLFRLMRNFWDMDEKSKPLLALFTALARDPLLRLTAEAILNLTPGHELSRQKFTATLTTTLHSRLNDSTIDKVLRNAASSWTQSGHLTGRMRKVRKRVEPSIAAVTWALLLGFLLGHRGAGLLHTLWAQLLDLGESRILELAVDAKRMGLLEMSQAGGVMMISFNTLLTDVERRQAYGTH